MERTHEVLALRQVDAGLAADRAVDHREQRGGRLHDVDAAVIDGRRETRGVADDSAAECDNEIAALQTPPGEAPAQVFDRRHGLGVFTRFDEEGFVFNFRTGVADEVPAKIPSSRARRRAIVRASSSGTARASS